MAQGGNEKVCPTCPPGSFNKHNDVMGSSFFTALGFLFIRTAELKLSCASPTLTFVIVTLRPRAIRLEFITHVSDEERRANTPTSVSNKFQLQHEAF